MRIRNPRVLDLFCGQGGAARGYADAGFDVTGVDIKDQPHYPYDFIQADALTYLADHGHEYDAIHASPPCRDYTVLTGRWGEAGSGWLLQATRELVRLSGRPYVIENVPGAPMIGPITLCGSMFGLGVRRHRQFESSVRLDQPACDHLGQGPIITVTGHPGGSSTRDGTQGRGSSVEWAGAMGITWMTVRGLAQAVPPLYTHFIGNYLLEAIAIQC